MTQISRLSSKTEFMTSCVIRAPDARAGADVSLRVLRVMRSLSGVLLGLCVVCSLPAGAAQAPAVEPAATATMPEPVAKHAAIKLALRSNAALVVDQDSGETLVMKNADEVMPIASLTKLMTALVVLDAKQPMDETLDISRDDVDTRKHTRSRLSVGTRLTRSQMLLLALMSSENRAAMSLSRNYPGGRPAFVAQMNAKARALGMTSTHFADPAGLSDQSVSTARDLHRLVSAAYAQPLIRSNTTHPQSVMRVKGHMVTFINTNRLVRKSSDWDIRLQKTGFTNEAGRCLVMQVNVQGRRLAMIFLDSFGKLTRYADALRVRRRIEQSLPHRMIGSSASVAGSR
ncbi:MAG: D-alanyl-D-alanine endopeptidase [Nevskiaceae bacterium]|nr:MAG: D-alanyl-D-alanine endopeptidase [Nevskiaceae bacterium]